MTKKRGTTRDKRRRQKRKTRLGGGKQASKVALQTIKVHPHLAKAILSLKKFAPNEIERLKGLSANMATYGSQPTACWISDSGGQQHCMNLPPDVCAREGGISVPTPCPNS